MKLSTGLWLIIAPWSQTPREMQWWSPVTSHKLTARGTEFLIDSLANWSSQELKHQTWDQGPALPSSTHFEEGPWPACASVSSLEKLWVVFGEYSIGKALHLLIIFRVFTVRQGPLPRGIAQRHGIYKNDSRWKLFCYSYTSPCTHKPAIPLVLSFCTNDTTCLKKITVNYIFTWLSSSFKCKDSWTYTTVKCSLCFYNWLIKKSGNVDLWALGSSRVLGLPRPFLSGGWLLCTQDVVKHAPEGSPELSYRLCQIPGMLQPQPCHLQTADSCSWCKLNDHELAPFFSFPSSSSGTFSW